MGRASAKKLHRYSLEFKRQALNLSPLEGVEVEAVAAVLDVLPLVPSRWREEKR